MPGVCLVLLVSWWFNVGFRASRGARRPSSEPAPSAAASGQQVDPTAYCLTVVGGA
jgi:hypothetical protein